MDRLNVATTFLAGLAVRQPEPPDDTSGLFSTRNVNNWQTLDIHHYLVTEATLNNDGMLTGDAVPMSMDAGYLTELSDLPVDLNLNHWNQRADSARALWLALDTVDSLQQQTRFRRGRAHPRARLARKLFESLDYFRRSLASDRWYAVTSLATAFEMLLTGHSTVGVAERLRRRVDLLTANTTAAQTVRDMYTARSDIVHAGNPPPEGLAIGLAQRTYLQCLEAVASRLDSVTAHETDPLRRITGDTQPNGDD